MTQFHDITAEECVGIIQKSRLYTYWDEENRKAVINLLKNTASRVLPEIMNDFMEQDKKIRQIEQKNASKEKKIENLLKQKERIKFLEEKDIQESQAYAEKLIQSLKKLTAEETKNTENIQNKDKKEKKKFLGIF